jgi:hypothetical protein
MPYFPPSTIGNSPVTSVVDANGLILTAGVLSFNGNQYLLKTGGTITGNLMVMGTTNIQGYFSAGQFIVNGAFVQTYGNTLDDGHGNLIVGNNLTASTIAGAHTVGSVSTGVLGSGTANNTTFLRGDLTWATGGGGGTSGYSGYSGGTGSAGTSGYSGYSGTTGGTGSAGTSGYSGYSGTTGGTGSAGTSGYSGYSGTTGGAGTSGYSGYSGKSGYSGSSFNSANYLPLAGGVLTGQFTLSADNGAIDVNYSGGAGGISFGSDGGAGFEIVDQGENTYEFTGGQFLINGSPASGETGTSGYSGYSGATGSGTSGYSGYSGKSGYSGVGTSGYSGYSGATPSLSGYLPLTGGTLTGGVKFTQAAIPWVTLTYASTTATDASTGSNFEITLTGNLTLSNPTNMYDGQLVMWRLIQDSTGSRTLTLGSAFNLGTDLATITLTTTASKTDYLTCVYRSSTGKWDVVGCLHGF